MKYSQILMKERVMVADIAETIHVNSMNDI